MIPKGSRPTKTGDISCHKSEGFKETFASYFR